MKILGILLVSLISFFNLSSKGTNYFIDQVEEGYSEYSVVYDNSGLGEDFELCVVVGINNENNCYGVFFSTNEHKYRVVVTDDKNVYSLPIDNDGSVWASAICFENDVQIKLYDASSDKVFTKASISIDDFASFTNTGNSMTLQFTTLTNVNSQFLKQVILYIVLGTVVVICLVVLIVLKVTHSGLFAKSNRMEPVLNMRDFLSSTPEESDPYDPLSNVTLTSNEEIKDEKEDQVINFDYKQYLLDKGFVLDYKTLDENEKNQIMLELMVLKNEGKISEEDYKKETVALWRK